MPLPQAVAVQLLSQPSPSVRLPSSHASPGCLMPLPQAMAEHRDGPPTHVKPFSIWQVAEQPSPPAVLPSSHDSPTSVELSPHSSEHTEPMPNALGTLTSRPSGLPVAPAALWTTTVMVLVPTM